ncbi:helix-turn-helix domain-containing protein [Gandjariella thermophila]|nr:helix-turn-helix domain-containing protein [Gandjariella thermophila]
MTRSGGMKSGSKPERERLRHEMLASGRGIAEIAAEMVRRWRFNPRQAWRYAHGLSQDEVAARCTALRGGDRAPLTGKRISDYEAWPQRGSRPTVRVLALLAQVYGARPGDLLGPDEWPLVPESDRLVLGHLVTTWIGVPDETEHHASHADDPGPEGSGPEVPGPAPRPAPLGPAALAPVALTPAAIRAAAHVSGEHAEWAEVTEVGPVTLEQLDHDATELARRYILVDPGEIFTELIRLRDRVYRLLARRSRPAQQTHLYLLAGQACGLLASASLELGCHDAAVEQANAAWAYAEIIGHRGLRAWLRGTQALIAFWSGRARESVQLARAGRDYLRGGTGFVRLCNIESRGWAHLGNRAETERVITMGHRTRDLPAAPDELHDVVGGEFGFDEARQAFCNAGAYVQLGMPKLAVRAAERALRLYPSTAERNRRYGGEASTRLEMTAAHLIDHALDAAGADLEPVVTAPEDRRPAQFGAKLAAIHATLNCPPYANSREARELAERIRVLATSTRGSG